MLQVQVPVCPNVLSAAYLEEVADGTNLTVCSEQDINLNGSAIALYNDTSYYDDLTFAATWLYKATGDSAYLTEAETWYVAHLYGTSTTSSVSILHSPPPPFVQLRAPAWSCSRRSAVLGSLIQCVRGVTLTPVLSLVMPFTESVAAMCV